MIKSSHSFRATNYTNHPFCFSGVMLEVLKLHSKRYQDRGIYRKGYHSLTTKFRENHMGTEKKVRRLNTPQLGRQKCMSESYKTLQINVNGKGEIYA